MLRTLLPQFGTVVVESVDVEKDMLVVTARIRAAPAECPGCGQWSAWEHGRCVRHLGDEAVGGRAVPIDIFGASAVLRKRGVSEGDVRGGGRLVDGAR
ncbi:hypothetical protein ACFYRL_36380 [Streptomyces goshikiensis]|uniref:hypothetical protein n=1 Tax=Streptomyces goshikiensis TaxID=1942 RepID=UPI00369641D6